MRTDSINNHIPESFNEYFNPSDPVEDIVAVVETMLEYDLDLRESSESKTQIKDFFEKHLLVSESTDESLQFMEALMNTVELLYYEGNDFVGKKDFLERRDQIQNEINRNQDGYNSELVDQLYLNFERDEVGMRVESLTTERVKYGVGIVGNIAAGKTTFMTTLVNLLSLKEARMGLISIEPEDFLEHYDDPESMSKANFRKFTRGLEATLGIERAHLFCYLPDIDQGQVLKINFHSSGGHSNANIDKRILAHSFFLDYGILKEVYDELSKLDPKDYQEPKQVEVDISTPEFNDAVLKYIDENNLNKDIEGFDLAMRAVKEQQSLVEPIPRREIKGELSNEEKLSVVLKSFWDRMYHFNSKDISSFYTLTKVPFDSRLDIEGHTKQIIKMYTKIIEFGRIMHEKDEYEQSDFKVAKGIRKIDTNDITLIYNDGPNYSGVLETAHQLVKNGLNAQGYNTQRMKLVCFGENTNLDYMITLKEVEALKNI